MKILSEENILEHKSEFELFVHYTGITDLKLGRLYRSPLYYQLDRKPSFNIFRSSRGTNSLMYKDFGNGSDTGNVFAFIAKLYGINYYQALKKVNEEFSLELDNNNIELINKYGKSNVTPRVLRVLNLQEEENDAAIPTKRVKAKVMQWTSKTYEYYRVLGIPKDLLKKAQVYPASVVYLDGKVHWRHFDNNPIYAVLEYDRDIIKKEGESVTWQDFLCKLKRPYNKDSKWKWLNSLPYSTIMLFNLIKHGKFSKVLVVKSSDDALFCWACGVPAVATVSENVRAELFGIFKTVSKHAEKIIMFYDNDEEGRKATAYIKDTFGYDFIEIPEIYTGCKDITDVARKFGVQVAKDLLFKLLESL